MKKKIVTFIMSIMMVFGLATTSLAAEKSASICFVDMQAIVNSYPGIKDVAQQIANKQIELQKKFDEQSKNLDAKGQAELQAKYNKELSDFENKKMTPIRKNINNAIKEVMATKGVDSVVNINSMVAGGEDLTGEVVNTLKK